MSESQPNNPFKLLHTRALDLSLQASNIVEQDQVQWSFKHQILLIDQPQSDDEQRIFIVEFDLRLATNKGTFMMTTKYHVTFQAEKPVTPEYLESPTIKVNAPAIAYPFVRSFVATVITNAGYPAIYLPSVNFVKRIAPELEKG
jgi:preprotein translocase subunit SecB